MVKLHRHWIGLVSGLALGLLSSFSNADTRATEAQRPALRLGIVDGFYPYFFVNAEGTPAGVVVDLWNRWSERSGQAISWTKSSQQALHRQLDEGKIDIIAAELSSFDDDRTIGTDLLQAERAIYSTRPVGGKAESLSALAIGAISRDPCVSWLRERGVTALQVFPSYNALASAIEGGRISAFCADSATGEQLTQRGGAAFTFQRSTPLFVQPIRWLVKAENGQLFQTVSNKFAAISEQERRAASQDWLDGRRIGGRGEETLWVWVGSAAALLAAAASKWLISWRRRRHDDAAHIQICRMAIENLPFGIFVTDPNGRVIGANKALGVLCGLRSDGDIRHWMDSIHPEDETEVTAYRRAQIAARRPSNDEYRLIRADGAAIWVAESSLPSWSPEGEFLGYVGTVRRVSDLAQAVSGPPEGDGAMIHFPIGGGAEPMAPVALRG